CSSAPSFTDTSVGAGATEVSATVPLADDPSIVQPATIPAASTVDTTAAPNRRSGEKPNFKKTTSALARGAPSAPLSTCQRNRSAKTDQEPTANHAFKTLMTCQKNIL